MILTAFDVKSHEKKDELPPEACRPSKKMKKTMSKKWNPKKLKINNVDNEGSPPARASGGSGGRSPPGRGKRGYIYIYIYLCISIDINIMSIIENQ